MAQMVFENLDQVLTWVRDSITEFGFHLDGDVRPTLGEDCADDIATGIRLRSVVENDQWEANEEEYAKWKEKKYASILVNFRTAISPGSMLSQESLLGVPAVTPHETVMLYGIDRAPSGSMTGYLNNDDTKRTDRQKAGYAYGDNVKGTIRAFYFLDDEYTNPPVHERIWRRLHRWLDERNQVP